MISITFSTTGNVTIHMVCRNGNSIMPSSQSLEAKSRVNGRKKNYKSNRWRKDDCSIITLSGVEAPDVTPIVMGPSGSQFSFSANSPCYPGINK